jgi:hypothetical protein
VHAGRRRSQPQGRSREIDRRHQHRWLLRQPRPPGDAGRCGPAAVVAPLAAPAAARGAAHRQLGGRRGPARQAAQGHHARRARHAGRPARQAVPGNAADRRQGGGAAAAQHLRHLRHPRLPGRAGAARQGQPRAGRHHRHAGRQPHHRGRPPAGVRGRRLGLPVLGYLRPTQNYVHLAARGLTLWDVAPGKVERDLEQWQGICRWLDA